MSSPAVSVAMSVFNSERYLAEAIESILNQTFTDFEFLIFDDGSTDRSPEIIREYAERDGRIAAVFSPTNRGYVVHLNEGIRRARGQYIARMDGDDVALPRRLEVQKRLLDTEREIAVAGASTITIDENGEGEVINRRQSSPSCLYWQSFFTNPFAHPTVMYRRDAVLSAGGYDEMKMPAEDYDLWTRLLPAWQFTNIKDPLLKYRQHADSVSVRKREIQRRNSGKALAELWKSQLGIDISEDEVLFLKGFHKGYNDLPAHLAPSVFDKIWALREKTRSRFAEVDDEVHRDAFRRGLYLAVRVRSVSVASFLRLSAQLVANYPNYTTKQVLYGRFA